MKELAGDFAEWRMAIGVGLVGDDDLEKAARVGGVRIDGRKPTATELIELAQAARSEELRAAREGHSSFSANVYGKYLALSAVTMFEELPILPSVARPHAHPDGAAGARRARRFEARLLQRRRQPRYRTPG